MENSGYVGRMRSYYNNKQYEEAVADAKRVSRVTDLPEEMLREAEYITARVFCFSIIGRGKPILLSFPKSLMTIMELRLPIC